MGFGIDPDGKSVPTYTLGLSGEPEARDTPAVVGAAWPNGRVMIHIKGNVSGEYAEAAKQTMKRWESCILEYWGIPLVRFVLSPMPGNGITNLVTPGSSSNGSIGYISNLPNGLVTTKVGHEGSLPHEFGHVLGLAHEHERPDAPAAIRESIMKRPMGMGRIMLQNSLSRYVTFGTGFDKKSIMMYADQAGSLDMDATNDHYGGCIISKQQVMSSGWWPSMGDLDMIGKIYRHPNA